ncbi:MAG: hypothetical protein CSA07_00175 [Bacteroidia bacterium]|nr:MAG: hypothetical protein CSA07_00175 [Bacteroidia bacterium]
MKKDMTVHEKLVQAVLREGKSLRRAERKKASEEYDASYVQEKIRKYRKGLYVSRLVHLLLYTTASAGVVFVLYYESIPEGYVLWVKILMCILLLVCILGAPSIMTNHGRNGSVLRILRYVQEDYRQEFSAQQAATSAAFEPEPAPAAREPEVAPSDGGPLEA